MFGFSREERRKKATALNNRAWDMHVAGQDEQAIPLFEQAIREMGTFARIWTNLAVTRAKLGQVEQALEDLNRALELDPRFSEAAFQRGKLRKDIGDYYGAIDDFSVAIDTDPKARGALRLRGNLYRDIGDHDLAVEDFLRLSDIDPASQTGFVGAGICYRWLQQWQHSLKMLTRAIELSPDKKPRALYWHRSYAQEGVGNLQAALADAETAISMTEEPAPDIEPHIRRYFLLQKLERFADAQFEKQLIHADRDRKTRTIAELGKFVWAALVMANTEIFEDGDEDRGGVVVFTFQRDIHHLGEFLAHIAREVVAIKGSRATTPEMQTLSRLTTNEYVSRIQRIQVPPSMTGGVEVYCQSIVFYRAYLQTGMLEETFIPCAATPGLDGKIVLLPWTVGEKKKTLLTA